MIANIQKQKQMHFYPFNRMYKTLLQWWICSIWMTQTKLQRMTWGKLQTTAVKDSIFLTKTAWLPVWTLCLLVVLTPFKIGEFCTYSVHYVQKL